MADPVTDADTRPIGAEEGQTAGAAREAAPAHPGPPEASGDVPVAEAPDAPVEARIEPAAAGHGAQPYAPDPAGARPKVDRSSLAPSEPLPIPVADSALGQTFHSASSGAAVGGSLLLGGATGGRDEAGPPAESPHAPRFQFILGALLALGLSAIAITAYALGSGRDPLPSDWSAWHPTASGLQAAGQIANHVAAEYRQPGTGQLLAVKGGPLALAGVPVTIAVKTGAAATGGISVLSGNGVLYKMCGLGPSCTIAGKASAQRLMLVRREALELALYTFNYVGGVDQVVVFLPPVLHPTAVPGQPGKVKVTADPTDAVFFRASDLSGELSHPLTDTLSRQTPSLTAVAASPDTPLVNQLTSPSFYKFSFVQTSQDASLFLVLEPFAVGN